MKQKIPFIIALSGMGLGVFIAILFGVNEDLFKDRIQQGLKQNEKINAIADTSERETKLKSEASKNWRYYQRFHFHSTGIGAMSLGILILLSLWSGPRVCHTFGAYATSIGGFLYPFVWLFAAMCGPQMGRHEAKESFAVFGYMGGVFLLGIFTAIYLVVRYPRRPLPITD